MKVKSLVLVATVVVAGLGLHSRLPAADQSQRGMNQTAAAELAANEAEMTIVLDKLAAQAKGRPEAKAKLDRAQTAWRVYRDLQLEAMWPFPERGAYGSVNPMCVAEARSVLTKARVSELRAMLEPIEGEVCNPQWPD